MPMIATHREHGHEDEADEGELYFEIAEFARIRSVNDATAHRFDKMSRILLDRCGINYFSRRLCLWQQRIDPLVRRDQDIPRSRLGFCPFL
jgi:hypothetical protein